MSAWGFENLDDLDSQAGDASEPQRVGVWGELLSHHDESERSASVYQHSPPSLPHPSSPAPALQSSSGGTPLDSFFASIQRQPSTTHDASLSPPRVSHLRVDVLPSPHIEPSERRRLARPYTAPLPDSSYSHEFVTLQDTDSEADNPGEMPPTTRQARRSSVIDLTEGVSAGPARAAKRKRSTETAARATRRRASGDEEEVIDLAEEASSAEEEFLQAQQQEAIRAQQQASEDSIPQKVGQRQCIICLENFTNCTATACGHVFCHECLHQALVAAARANDRGNGSCPVCRKNLSHKKKSDMIPINFMTKKHYDKHYKDKPHV